MPDQVYSEANPAAHGGPRRPEPFVELGLMSKQPPSDHAFWYVKRWETERVDEFDPWSGLPLAAPTSGVKDSQKVAKPKLGGFGCSPRYNAYHNGPDEAGRPKVFGQPDPRRADVFFGVVRRGWHFGGRVASWRARASARRRDVPAGRGRTLRRGRAGRGRSRTRSTWWPRWPTTTRRCRIRGSRSRRWVHNIWPNNTNM